MPTVFYGYQKSFSKTDDTKDSSGRITGRIVTTSIMRMPDQLLLTEQKDTYTIAPLGGGFSGSGLKLSESETSTCQWEASSYGPTGPVNQPSLLSKISRIYAWKVLEAPVSGMVFSAVWTEIRRMEEQWAYNAQKQVTAHNINTLELIKGPDGWKLRPKSTDVKTFTQLDGKGGGWLGLRSDHIDWPSSFVLAKKAAEADLGTVSFSDSSMGSGSPPGGIRSGGR